MSRTPPSPPVPSPSSASGPVREAYAGEESPTLAKNARLILYQKLVACVDALDLAAATDLVEIACLYADVPAEKRARMLTACRWLGE